MYLKAEVILRYLIGENDKLDTLIMCKSSGIDLVTSDQSLYEAIGSIMPEDGFKLPKLIKLLEVVDIVSYKSGTSHPRKILKPNRVHELRSLVLGKTSVQKRE